MATITTKSITSLAKKPGSWLSERLNHGHGTLAFRCLANGEIGIYFRYLDNGKRVALPIGRYDEKGVKGITLSAARSKAGEFSLQHAGGLVAIREHIEADQHAKNEALRKAKIGTFGQLLNAYVHALESEGKQSARQVKTLFEKWIFLPYPDLAERQAGKVGHDDVMRILTNAAQAGVTRTVNKLRSYILAAFNKAIKARGNPKLAATIGMDYSIEANPVVLTERVREFEAVRDRTLTRNELKTLLLALDEIESARPQVTTAIRLAIMLGGQRPQQLLRVKRSDVDLDAKMLKILDPKGRRTQARIHTLPILPQTLPYFKTLLAYTPDAEFLFTNDGKRPVSIDTLSSAVTQISEGAYQLRDLRRTSETMLAALGISKDLRAQIQSHGLGGVQDRHYDRHDYMPEKRRALEKWNCELEQIRRAE